MFNQLDHVAILVKDTAEALTFYRDTLRLKVLLSEELVEVGVRLTHLDAGNVKLQLVEPLRDDHPLQVQLLEKGEHLHHLCWGVDNTREAMKNLVAHGLEAKAGEPHPAPQNGEAAFIEPSKTRGVLWEMTGQSSVDS